MTSLSALNNVHIPGLYGNYKKKDENSLIKILGRGKIKSKVNIKSHMFSKSAIKSIEKVGGKVQIISND